MSDITVPDDLRLEFERGFIVGDAGPSILEIRHTGKLPWEPWLAPTGEEYQVLEGTGGEDAMRSAFKAYASGKSGRLYWRMPPEIETTTGRWYMRLLISEKDETNVST